MTVKNTNLIVITNGHDTIPLSVVKTGTIETEGIIVRGSLTKFISEISMGDWIYDPAQDEIHQVTGISSDTVLMIREKFSSDIAAGATLRVAQSLYLRIEGIFDAAGEVDNQAVPADVPLTWDVQEGGVRPKNLDPICVDAASATATFTATQ